MTGPRTVLALLPILIVPAPTLIYDARVALREETIIVTRSLPASPDSLGLPRAWSLCFLNLRPDSFVKRQSWLDLSMGEGIHTLPQEGLEVRNRERLQEFYDDRIVSVAADLFGGLEVVTLADRIEVINDGDVASAAVLSAESPHDTIRAVFPRGWSSPRRAVVVCYRETAQPEFEHGVLFTLDPGATKPRASAQTSARGNLSIDYVDPEGCGFLTRDSETGDLEQRGTCSARWPALPRDEYILSASINDSAATVLSVGPGGLRLRTPIADYVLNTPWDHHSLPASDGRGLVAFLGSEGDSIELCLWRPPGEPMRFTLPIHEANGSTPLSLAWAKGSDYVAMGGYGHQDSTRVLINRLAKAAEFDSLR